MTFQRNQPQQRDRASDPDLEVANDGDLDVGDPPTGSEGTIDADGVRDLPAPDGGHRMEDPT